MESDEQGTAGSPMLAKTESVGAEVVIVGGAMRFSPNEVRVAAAAASFSDRPQAGLVQDATAP